MVVELTERALTDRPAEVLAAVAALREHGCGIALDDVGVDKRSLALMPFVAPDVIKLDMSLIQQRGTSPSAARVLNAVAAEAERSGARLLAGGDRDRGAPRTGARGRRDARPGLALRPPRPAARRAGARVDRLPLRAATAPARHAVRADRRHAPGPARRQAPAARALAPARGRGEPARR